MPETVNAGSPAESENTLGEFAGYAPSEVLHFDGGAIDRLAGLGASAERISIGNLDTLGRFGLPDAIPVGIKNGPNGGAFSVKSLIEEYRYFPERKTGTARALTLQSLLDLVNRHKTADTAIFADSDWHKPQITAVIDYHALTPDGEPAWLKHRITYAFPLSDPWKAWIAQNGMKMTQTDFALFLEDHIADLSSPEEAEATHYESLFSTKVATPAELIQLSRGLQVFSGTKVKNAVTLQSGEAALTFEEVHNDANGNKLTVPGLFILNIAPFFMGDPIRIPVRLRYRLAGGDIVWLFQIYRPDLQITDRVRADLDIIRKETSLPVFEGFPEGTPPA